MIVRIKEFDENHINAYARVEYVNFQEGVVCVSNTNMPFLGTLSHVEFNLDDIDFIKTSSEFENEQQFTKGDF